MVPTLPLHVSIPFLMHTARISPDTGCTGLGQEPRAGKDQRRQASGRPASAHPAPGNVPGPREHPCPGAAQPGRLIWPQTLCS